MFLNLHLSAQPPSHLHLSSLNLSHNPPSQPPSSSFISQPFSQSSLNIFISHLSQTFFKALSTTPLLPQSRSGERTIIMSHLSIFLFFSLSIVN
ncbi:hypothetical protein NC651_008025 [Populus alba x Populus x berolinensis]|nr:hypothetical protein NC651_008025 [Populus alba x Populus x berolinensis]